MQQTTEDRRFVVKVESTPDCGVQRTYCYRRATASLRAKYIAQDLEFWIDVESRVTKRNILPENEKIQGD